MDKVMTKEMMHWCIRDQMPAELIINKLVKTIIFD